MKKILFLLAIFTFSSAIEIMAQSGMTDKQIIDYVVREQERGTPRSQIVTHLMQRGVKIDQIHSIQKKIQEGNEVMNAKDLGNSTYAQSRLRNKNAKSKKGKADDDGELMTNGRKESYNTNKVDYEHTYDENDPEYVEMSTELGKLYLDSVDLLVEERLAKYRKKVFGRDIFNNKLLSFEPNMNIATPQNYVVGPGDNVIIDIWGASQKSLNQEVSPDGTITVEGFGPIEIGGLSISKANALIRSRLGSRYRSSKIKMTLGQSRTITINVMGEVKVPGTYTLSAFASVFHALYMAGGISDIGTLRDIKVYRKGKLMSNVDIYDYILNGKMSGNIRMNDGDVIVVGPYDCLVNISGKVKRPMYYEMKRNESLASLLRYSGGFTGDAYKKSVRVMRKDGAEYSVFNVNEFETNEFRLADADSVTVDSVINRYSNMVEVKGAVFRPGMYNVGTNITTIKQLIEAASGVTEDAFKTHAVLHRLKADRTLEAKSVDIEGILSGKVADIPIRNGDVLFVPSVKDRIKDRKISIFGEVFYPGTYEYAENETLEDFILQAGGLKDNASTAKIDVSRRINNPASTESSDQLAQTFTFSLKDGFVINGDSSFKLKPYDEVYVRISPEYNVQQNVYVDGEITYRGVYTLAKKTERLSDLVNKAGGVTKMGYVRGARLERKTNSAERARMESVLKVAQQSATGEDSISLAKVKLGDTYSVGIELDKALANPGSEYDIVLREGDVLQIPQYTNTVRVSGNVMYPNTVPFHKGNSIRKYVNQAGGYGLRSKKSHTYIVYMNGMVAKAGNGVKAEPGCEIVVPSKPKANGNAIAQWLSIGTGLASIATMIATIANLSK